MRNKREIWLLIILSLAVAAIAQYPALTNYYLVEDDVAQRLFFIPKLYDDSLFQNDLVTMFSSSPAFNPPAYLLVYYLFGFFLPVAVASKIVPFILSVLTMIFLFRLGKELGTKNSGVLLAILGIFHLWYMRFFSGGLQRGIVVPIIVAFLYYLVKKDPLKIAITLFLEALIYPPASLLCALTYFFATSFSGWNKRRAAIFSWTAMACMLVALPLAFYHNAEIGPLVSYEEAKSMAEFGNNGRVPIFYSSFLEAITSDSDDVGLRFGSGILFFVSLTLFLVLGRKSIALREELWLFVSSGVILYLLAYFFMFKEFIGGLQLYNPSKYLKYSLPFFLLIFISVNFSRLLAKFKVRKTARTGSYIILIISAALFYSANFEYVFLDCNHPALYDYLLTVPKDSVLSGHPDTMDCIPLYTQRKVLFSYEHNIPYYSSYYSEIKNRTYAGLDAFYSESIDSVSEFCVNYGVDYLIIDRRYFLPRYFNFGTRPFEPFYSYILNTFKNKSFALESISPKKMDFDDGELFVVNCYNLQQPTLP